MEILKVIVFFLFWPRQTIRNNSYIEDMECLGEKKKMLQNSFIM